MSDYSYSRWAYIGSLPGQHEKTIDGYTHTHTDMQWQYRDVFNMPPTIINYPDNHPSANSIWYTYHYDITPSGGAAGDPHITTFDGDHYTL